MNTLNTNNSLQVIKTNNVPQDESHQLLGQSLSESGNNQVLVRKATEGKHIYFEVWG